MSKRYLLPDEATKRRARSRYSKALRDGELTRPSVCSRCGGDGGDKPIEGHHPDYWKPLDVVWLCRTCHVDEHRGDRRLPVLGPTGEPGFVATSTVASMLKVPVPEVRRMARAGELSAVRPGGGHGPYRFRLENVKALAEEVA